MLGRARRAVLAVAGTAEGMLGARARRKTGDPPPPPRTPAAVRMEPKAGLPPRIERQSQTVLPPRIGPEPTAGLPPRIERERSAGLPPRIERKPTPAPPPKVERTPAPEPAPAPPPPIEPEPVAEPVRFPELPRAPGTMRRAGMRANMWLSIIILVVLVVGTGGYWALRVHQRIGQAALQHELGKRTGAPTVGCAKLQADGAVWACAIVYQVESECLIAKVNVIGSWSTAVGQHRCGQLPQLASLVPKITATGVAADVSRLSPGAGRTVVCLKQPGHHYRWACQGAQSASGSGCILVRVMPWTAWNVNAASEHVCSKIPALVKKVHAAGE
jgi:hypothetical protein